jgi:hypothetical protein
MKLARHCAVFATPANRSYPDPRTARACLVWLGRMAGDVDGRIRPRARAAPPANRNAKGWPAHELDADVPARLRADAGI